jgi:hypothetical protein
VRPRRLARGLTHEERRQLLLFVDTDKVAIGADLPDLIRFATDPSCGSRSCARALSRPES